MTEPTLQNAGLAAATDICVKCGLCLPHCPTYQNSSDENESPRGRLSLIQGWATGRLELTPKLKNHVDHCLLCRSCEAACPANVAYGRIVDDFRAACKEHGAPEPQGERAVQNLALALLTGNQPRLIQSGLGHIARSSAGQSIARQFGLESMAQGLPQKRSGTRTIKPGLYTPKSSHSHGSVQLFLGCTAVLFDSETLDACVHLLNALGIAVEVPDDQGCCGALDQHAGERAKALEMIARNETAFGGSRTDPVISCATGCGAMLQDHASSGIGSRHKDISDYLSSLPWPEALPVAPLDATVILHTPCSLRNVLKSPSAGSKLLDRIPKLKVLPVPSAIRCCGAAGSFMLHYPDEASSYRETILQEILETQPQFILSSNPGCAAHLRSGLQQKGLNIEVLHPISLLWRQIQSSLDPRDQSR